MGKIWKSSAVIIAIAAAVGGATYSYFSDTETSTGNTFTAGAIDLKIDNESYVTDTQGVLVASPKNSWQLSNLTNQLFFSFSDVKPGDIGEDTISLHVDNNDAYACMAAKITGKPDNGIDEPESDAGDTTDGAQGGELQNFLNFAFWNDDGDNVYEEGEGPIQPWTGKAADIFNGTWAPVADSQHGTPIAVGQTRYIGKAWCFGTLIAAPKTQDGNGKTGQNGPLARGTGFTCSGAGDQNVAQTDGILADVSFYAVQTRNNAGFLCSSLPAFAGSSKVVDVKTGDLATSLQDIAGNVNKWFFYNDTNDTIMTQNQFAGTGGVNDIVSGPEGVGSAEMVLDNGTTLPDYQNHIGQPRYNIATTKYAGVKLSDFNALKYRVYDSTNDSDKPFLNFNVDFNNSNVWQKRLVYVPTTLAVNTWTEVDTLQGGAGMWLYSGANWPAGSTSNGSIAGTTARSWSSILADYPNARTLSTGAWLGVRVGEPGPAGATGYVDWVNFNGEVTDFVN